MNKENVAYICIFLRNAGENCRAAILARDTFGCHLLDAIRWVRTVKLDRIVESNQRARDVFAEYPTPLIDAETLRDIVVYRVSHWPDGSTAGLRSESVAAVGMPSASTETQT